MIVDENLNVDSNRIIMDSFSSSSVHSKVKVQPPHGPPPQLTDAKLAVRSPNAEKGAELNKEDNNIDVDPLDNKSKPSAELLVFGVDSNGNAPSLQDSFKRFRKQKVKERKIMQLCKEELTTKGPRSPEFKANLRMKFIDQAKK
jgi:hypothetical protein